MGGGFIARRNFEHEKLIPSQRPSLPIQRASRPCAAFPHLATRIAPLRLASSSAATTPASTHEPSIPSTDTIRQTRPHPQARTPPPISTPLSRHSPQNDEGQRGLSERRISGAQSWRPSRPLRQRRPQGSRAGNVSMARRLLASREVRGGQLELFGREPGFCYPIAPPKRGATKGRKKSVIPAATPRSSLLTLPQGKIASPHKPFVSRQCPG